MKLQTYLFVGSYMCFCNLFMVYNVKALVGEEVRQVIDDDEFPFIVSIAIIHPYNIGQFKHICGGALVSNRDVLTAEHCLEEKYPGHIRVIVGSRDLRFGKKYPLLWWLVYNQWVKHNNFPKPYEHNDIAVLRLQGKVSDQIKPGVLSTFRNHKLEAYTVELAGWGKKADDTYSIIMETAMVKVIDLSECMYRVSKAQGQRIYIETSFFCTKANPLVLVRKGDSGGPVLLFNEIIGITIANCPVLQVPIHPDKLNVHLGTFNYRNFIYDTMQIP